MSAKHHIPGHRQTVNGQQYLHSSLEIHYCSEYITHERRSARMVPLFVYVLPLVGYPSIGRSGEKEDQ